MTVSTEQSSAKRLIGSCLYFSSAFFYILFTLLPNSHSLMVKWPWVSVWQFGLTTGPVVVVWQLWNQQFRRLGSYLDLMSIFLCVYLVLNAHFAVFSAQSYWYSWQVICAVSWVYVLVSWFVSAKQVQKLLTFQGFLMTAFIWSSSLFWISQTLQPYLQQAELTSYGAKLSFDFANISLRNWYPLGHQNYVAGYLLLGLPLLGGLAVTACGKFRYFWISSFFLGCFNLYSTGSRGSWFGLFSSTVTFILLSVLLYPKYRKLLIASGLSSLVFFCLWCVSNNRLRGLFLSIFTSSEHSSNETAYRIITNFTGWTIGLEQFPFGAGLGNVPLLYQRYRPFWAGQEAELTYQLHSTPAQIWAELGLIGSSFSIVVVVVICFLSRACLQSVSSQGSSSYHLLPLIVAIISGFTGYIIYALTDFQLDNVCITGSCIIFLSALISIRQQSSIADETPRFQLCLFQKTEKTRFFQALTGVSVLVSIAFWLYPIHRGWMLSSIGFARLQLSDISGFVSALEKAHQLVPWEPYYPYQLGWNLGELSYKTDDFKQAEILRQESISWFKRAIKHSPDREFGYSNLGWLLVATEPQKATDMFLNSARLVPAKNGVFFALGYSLMKQNKENEAIQSMVVEILRQPLLITSPVWKSSELSSVYPQVLSQLEVSLTHLSKSTHSPTNLSYFQQVLGALQWWKGDFNQAKITLSNLPTPLNQSMIALAEVRVHETDSFVTATKSPAHSMISSWIDPDHRDFHITEALRFVLNRKELSSIETIPNLVSELSGSQRRSSSFHEWLTENAPVRSLLNERIGFGVISRHTDGPIPTDFSPRLENILMTDFFQDFISSPVYDPAIDKLLNPMRETLISQLSEL
ncbi:MAG: O-antigen ligase family protein [Phormidesmis sp.]